MQIDFKCYSQLIKFRLSATVVFSALIGYLLVAQKLFEDGPSGVDNWNFGPYKDSIKPVSLIADLFCETWGNGLSWKHERESSLHEAEYLSLDISKAKRTLGWSPKWKIDKVIEKVVSWHKAEIEGQDLFKLTLDQIEEYLDQT